MSIFNKIKEKLGWRSDKVVYSSGLVRKNNQLMNKLLLLFEEESQIDDAWYEKLMITLIQADMSSKTAAKLIKEFQEQLLINQIVEKEFAKDVFIHVLNSFYGDDIKPYDIVSGRLNVILMIGVNGSGKTTSTAKLANYYLNMGYKVGVVAADTFRAAAVSQLQLWAEKLNIPCYIGNLNSDPASVVVDGIKSALNDNLDLIIIDTAGRLQNKVNLMNELAKINRVVNKFLNYEVDATYLVLDASLGQNSLNQAIEFNKAAAINGIILTKMDGSAKGCIIFSIIDEMNLKVAFIGLGEKLDDLRPFYRKLYFETLLEHGKI